jgi:hypothetical protein
MDNSANTRPPNSTPNSTPNATPNTSNAPAVGGKSRKHKKSTTKKPKLHTGKQGGKYYIKKGKKVYV